MRQEHLNRMKDEESLLLDRIGKLSRFIVYAPEFSALDMGQQGLLRTQLKCMEAYHTILALRIETATVED